MDPKWDLVGLHGYLLLSQIAYPQIQQTVICYRDRTGTIDLQPPNASAQLYLVEYHGLLCQPLWINQDKCQL